MASVRGASASSRENNVFAHDRDSSRGSKEGKRSSPYEFSDEPRTELHELSTLNGSADGGGSRRGNSLSQFEQNANTTSSIDIRGLENSGPQATGLESLPNLHGDVPRPLNWQDVAALIINKMVGTGIYTTPPVVLLLTRSKGEALGLWITGFVYTLISMTIYLEYARRLPHTGGELIYLDETMPRPRLLAYTMYTFYLVLLYNSATNGMQFANQVLTCAAGDTANFNPDVRALRFIAIVAVSFFCLLHYFSGRVGRDLNQVLAFIKTALLFIILIAGCVRAGRHFTPDWKSKPNGDVSSSATAFLYILFTFSGWENATYVAGEIPNHKTLRKGFVAAVLLVGALYISINMVFLLAVPYASLDPAADYAPLFFGGGYKARLTWAALIAVSASGSLLADTYTSARVKQVIGMCNILPWSRIWRANSPRRVDDDGNPVALPTPQGGLILHWLFSLLFIIATCRIHNISEAISFSGNIQAYGAGWIGVFISIGFPFLFLQPESRLFKKIPFIKFFGKRIKLTPRQQRPPLRDLHLDDSPDGQFRETSWSRFLGKRYWFFAIAYLIFNAFIVIVPLIGPYTDGNGNKLEVKGWYYVVIVACVWGCALLYYLATFSRTAVRTGARGRLTHAQILEEVRQYPDKQPSIMNVAGVHPEIIEDEYNDPQYGNRRIVKVVVDSEKPSFLYLLFGGSDTRHTRALGISDFWDMLVARKEPVEED